MKLLVYCLLRAGERAWASPPPGVDGCRVRVIGDDGLAAAVSHVPDSCAVPSVARATAYARVVEAFHQTHTVLPMRYGCLPETEAQTLDLVRERRAEFLTILDELDGCVEMGVRVLLPGAQEPVPARAAGGDEQSCGRAYLVARQALYGARDSGEGAAALLAERMRCALDGLFVASRAEHSLARQPWLLSLHLLVRRADVALLRDVFGRVEEGSSERMLLTGPWPPYNFAECELLGRRQPEHRTGDASATYSALAMDAKQRSRGSRRIAHPPGSHKSLWHGRMQK